MDENCQIPNETENHINANRLLFRNWKKLGLPDDELLALATGKGYTLVTRDRGLILMAVRKGIPIIYYTPDQWFYVVGTLFKGTIKI